MANRIMSKNYSLIVYVWMLGLGCCWAEPIARSAEFWAEYDLIAEVDIRSLDSQADIQFSSAGASRGFGHAATVEVVNALRLPSDTNQWSILVPVYWMYDGQRLPAFPFDEQLINPGPHKIACCWSGDHAWMVLKEILPDELWARYEAQKNSGETNAPPRISESMKLLQEQQREVEKALDKIGEYGKQLDGGKLTWEEFKQLTEPLEKIVQQPITMEIE